jgi:glutathione reductase (NADPH)
MIAGGGYIANEFAGIFNEFGSHVTVVNRTDVILRGYDHSVRDRLLQISLTKGIDFRFHAEFERIEKLENGCLKVFLTGQEPTEVDVVMFATGRVPNSTVGLWASSRTRRGDRRSRARSRSMRTTVRTFDSIYAVGDVTNRIQLTPIAIREGQAFADTVFGNKPTTVDYENACPARCSATRRSPAWG